MAFDTNSPYYSKWQQASQARQKALSLYNQNKGNATLANKYKNAYNQAKQLQNQYAAQVRSYKPAQAQSKPKIANIDTTARANAITAGQAASNTSRPKVKTSGLYYNRLNNTLKGLSKSQQSAFVNKYKTDSTYRTKINNYINNGGNSIPTVNTTNNYNTTPITSNKPTTNTSSQTTTQTATPSTTTYNSTFDNNKYTVPNTGTGGVTPTVNNNNFNPASGGAAFQDAYKKIGFLGGKNINADTFSKYGGVDKYINDYSNNLNNNVKSGKMSQAEANYLKSQMIKLAKDKAGYTDPNDIHTVDAGTGVLQTGYDTYTDSEGNTHRTPHYTSINYNDIANKVGGAIFGNKAFQDNLNTYLGSLKSQIELQRKSLDAANSQLREMYKNMEGDFQSQYGDILNKINQREQETKTRLGQIEGGIKQKFEDVSKTLGEQAAGEKSGIAANLRAKGLSEGAISNALSSIDKKYEQAHRKDYAAYTDNLKSLAQSYDNLASNIISNRTNLTKDKLAFANALQSKAKALIDASRQFDQNAINTIYKPINDIYSQRVQGDKTEQSKIDAKVRKIEEFKNADQSLRLKILSDNLINLKGLGIDTSKITNDILAEAAKFNDITQALTYVKEKLYGGDPKSASAIDKLTNVYKNIGGGDNNVKVKTIDKKSGVATSDGGKTLDDSLGHGDVDKQDSNLISDTISSVTNEVPELNNNDGSISQEDIKKTLNLYKQKMSDADYKVLNDIGNTIETIKQAGQVSPESRDLMKRQAAILHKKYPDLMIGQFLKGITVNKEKAIKNDIDKTISEVSIGTGYPEDKIKEFINVSNSKGLPSSDIIKKINNSSFNDIDKDIDYYKRTNNITKKYDEYFNNPFSFNSSNN